MGRGNSGPASPTHRQCPLRVCTRKEPCDLAALACGTGPRWDLSIEGRVLHHNSNPDTVSSISDLQRRAWGGPAHPHILSLSKDSILRGFDVMVHTVTIEARAAIPNRRRRFQRGSLQKRKSGGGWNWIAFWWQDRRRRGQILGPCSTMSRSEALAEMTKRLQPVNARAGEALTRLWTVGDWIEEVFLPFSRRKWKLSTASTSGDRIRKHLIADLGSLEIHAITRDLLQQYLEQKLSNR